MASEGGEGRDFTIEHEAAYQLASVTQAIADLIGCRAGAMREGVSVLVECEKRLRLIAVREKKRKSKASDHSN